MNLSDCYYLGYVSRVMESRNQIEVKLDVDDPSDYKKIESVLVQLKKSDQAPIPLFIEHVVSISGHTARLSLQTEQVMIPLHQLKGLSLYRPLSSLKPLSGKAFYFHEIIGFLVRDKDRGEIGQVSGIQEMPSNPILVILNNDKEILIPIRDEIIVGLDRKNKILDVSAPEGLIDLYLS